MKVKHNKKRNVGLLFAQLSQSVSESMVEGDSKKATKTLSIIKKHFVPGTELFKEFRLFRAIMVTSVPTDSLASSIIQEAKTASKNINTKTLTQQKSSLIKDINYEMNESSFYNRRVADYKTFATVQTLLSEWRNKSPDLSVMAKFETELHLHLLKEKVIADLQELKSTDANHLVVDIMRKKIEEKFDSQLTSGQLSLLKEYVFFDHKNNSFLEKLSMVQRRGDPRVFEALILHSLLTDKLDFESVDGLEVVASTVKDYLDQNYPDEIPVRFTIEKEPSKYIPIPDEVDEEGEVVSFEPRIEVSPYYRVVMRTRMAGGERRTFIDSQSRIKAPYDSAARILEKLPSLKSDAFSLVQGEDETEASSIRELLDMLLAIGRKGMDFQRYKGLGEMNPEQLWETTMDPEVRTLLQVRIDDTVNADDVFTVLMGDSVEPRRLFIEENALSVKNLDV